MIMIKEDLAMMMMMIQQCQGDGGHGKEYGVTICLIQTPNGIVIINDMGHE